MNILSVILWLPIVAAIVLLVLPRNAQGLLKSWALGASIETVDPAVGHHLLARHRRHHALARPSHDASHAGRPSLLMELDP
jgi:hypothetical protein